MKNETLAVGLDDYNPYCASNRDPGASGPDQCADYQKVKPKPRPTRHPVRAGTGRGPDQCADYQKVKPKLRPTRHPVRAGTGRVTAERSAIHAVILSLTLMWHAIFI